MKDLDFVTLYAVLYEMMGIGLWLLFLLALVGVGLCVYTFLKEKGTIDSQRLVRSELIGLVGGFLAILLMQKITDSGFSDVGGPIDWFVILLIWALGGLGATVLSYGALGYVSAKAK